MTKAIENLINKYGAETLKTMIDDIVYKEQDYKDLKAVLSTDDTALEWFTAWAKSHNLEIEQSQYYNGKMYYVKGWTSNSSYVYLWLTQGKGRNENPVHFELGSCLSDLWWVNGLKDLERKLDRIIDMRVEEAA